MCSRTVAVSGVWAAKPRFCRPAPWIPPPHSGQKKAAPMSPAATTSPAFADTNMSTSCGTSPRDVLPPNPLRDAAEETASHRHDEADGAPAICAKRQDAQPVGERHDRSKQKEGTREVAVETTAAGCV